jgi:DNA-binding response OmpR family regulator
LVVEDSEAIRVPVQTALRAQGFDVRSRPDGSGLEAELGGFAPDLVVLDVMLPGRDGFELLPLVRRGSQAAVLMLTARDSVADRVAGLATTTS